MELTPKRILQLCGGLLLLLLLYRLVFPEGPVPVESGPGSDLEALLIEVGKYFAAIYLELFNNPATAIYLSVGLVATGIFLSIWFWLARILPFCRTLDKLTAIANWRPTPGKGAEMDHLDEAMLETPGLGTDWMAYRAAVAAGGSNAFVRPGQFISLRSFDRQGLNLGFFQAVPGYFVGLGLVFTFLGLVAGLYFASRGMRTGNLEQAREALIHLLNAATFKFMTSIAGVSMSLVFSVSFRLGVQRLRARIDHLCTRIEARALLNAFPATAPGRSAEPAPLTPRLVEVGQPPASGDPGAGAQIAR